jgi:hypothetical protein
MRRLVRTVLRALNLVADPAAVEPAAVEPGIFIHEDYVGMRNLHPLIAEDEIAASVHAAAEASERNRAPGGVGWTSVHVIQPPKTDFTAVGLAVAAAGAALEAALPRLHRFHSGSLSSRGSDPFAVDEHDAHAYGFDANCFVKLETRGDEVAAIWFDLAPEPSPERRDALRAALVALDRLVPCVVADYWLDMNGRVGDAAFLDHYFAQI